MANILMVVSAADSLTMKDGSEHPTGFWAEELVVSHQLLQAAGHTVHLATPRGVKPTVDQVSLAPESAGGKERADGFRDYLASIDAELAAPLALADVDISSYDAVVLPGGHGPMTDLYQDADLGRLLVAADTAGKVIAPFCHGPCRAPERNARRRFVRLRGAPPHRFYQRGGAHRRHRREHAVAG